MGHTALKLVSVFVNNGPNEWHIQTGKWGEPSIAVVDTETHGQRIVQCCNLYPEMVQALKRAEALLDGPIGDLLTGDQMAEAGAYDTLERIRAILEGIEKE